MHDSTNLTNHGASRSEQSTVAMPRQLAVASLALVMVLAATGLALWLVAGRVDVVHDQPLATVSVPTPTSELITELSAKLGPTTTEADLEAAVQEWLAEQQTPSHHLARTAYSG